MGSSRIANHKSSLPLAGSYILLINLPDEQIISVGSRQNVHFQRGYYAYVGSAMGGFKARLNRHLKDNKKPHWHIDYLLQEAQITNIIVCETEYRVECAIAQALQRQLDSVPGFGSSDCRCRSHLFFARDGEKLKPTVTTVIESLGIEPKLTSSVLPPTLL